MDAQAHPGTYATRRGEVEVYFDRTAADAWARLTSDAPVGRIRQTVRAGRNRMRDLLLDWLPRDLSGTRILDAGCGPGQLAVEAARRGASVVGVDLSSTLIGLAGERHRTETFGARMTFHVGDMLDPALGTFDHVVSMDALIHYQPADAVTALEQWAGRTRRSIVVTIAPRTPALAIMHATGRLFPNANRAPAIVPVSIDAFAAALRASPRLAEWSVGRTERVASGFYTSQALELVRR